MLQLLDFKNVAYIVTEGSVLAGQRLSKKFIETGLLSIKEGKCDAAVMSILVGGAELNCQSMNKIIFMDSLTSDVVKKQAKGNSSEIL